MWRNTPEEEIKDRKMAVHIFGKINSPCIAHWVIKRTASDQSSEYPVDIINIIHKTFYMDNYVDCFTLRKECPYSELFWSAFFPTFGLNTERYGASLRIQCECGKKRTRKTPNKDTFHAVLALKKGLLIPFRKLPLFCQTVDSN